MECSNKERCVCVWECCSSWYVVVFENGNNDNWMLLVNCKGCIDVFMILYLTKYVNMNYREKINQFNTYTTETIYIHVNQILQ